MQRKALARIISGSHGESLDLEACNGDGLLEVAIFEGVVSLASQRLRDDSAVAEALRIEFASCARAAAAAHLVLESEAGRILAVLQQLDIPVLVLKGAALGQWLFPASYLREISDIDLLFATRANAERAALELAPHGYAVPYFPGDMAHEFPCRRVGPGKKVNLDMHWHLANMPLLRDLFSFSELLEASIALPGLGTGARGLGQVHALLHACLHRAENLTAGIGDRLKWLYDVHLIACRLDPNDWELLLGVCLDRGICGICAESIDAAAALFGSVVPVQVHKALHASRSNEAIDASRLTDWTYMQLKNLAALRTFRERRRWLWQRALPPTGYLRDLYGVERGAVTLWSRRLKEAFGRLKA